MGLLDKNDVNMVHPSSDINSFKPYSFRLIIIK